MNNTVHEHWNAWVNDPKYIGTYRGVIVYMSANKFFPYSGLGIVWEAKSIRAIKEYIDKAIDSGNQSVNERGALLYCKTA